MNLKKLIGVSALAAAMYGSAATAEIVIGAGSGSGSPTDTLTIPLTFDCQAGENPEAAQWDIVFDTDVLSADTTNCLSDISPPGAELNFSSCNVVGLMDGAGTGNDAVRVVLLFNPAANVCDSTAAGSVGSVDFTIDGGALPGPSPLSIVIEAIDGSPASSTDDGLITVDAPAGAGFYASTPAPGDTLALGSAVVGQTTTPDIDLNIQNLSPDTAFDVTSIDQTSGPAMVLNTPAGATIPFGGNADFPFSCTPSQRTANDGTFEVTHDAANGAMSPVEYGFTCAGESPIVSVAGPGPLSGSTADMSGPTGNITVTNPQDGFTSTATNVTATAQPGDGEITVSGGPTDVAPDGSFDFLVSCDNTAASSPTFNRDILVTWDDPLGPGEATISVECTITDVAPGYSSDPMPNALLAFGQVENGDSSAAQTIDIGNENSIGMGAGAELDITGATLSDAVNYSFSPDPLTATLPAGAANGTASVDVTCNPQSIGNFPGTLTINTNDGDQDYDLSCEGTSNAELSVTPASAVDGTLLLGTVPANTLVSGSLTLSNLGTDPLDIDCTLTDNNGGVIVANPMPMFPISIPPDLTLTFDGVPPNVGSFEETLECTVTDPSVTGAPDTFSTTISVAGRPLAIPTMSPWALAVMSLMLLLVAGFAGRRMMA